MEVWGVGGRYGEREGGGGGEREGGGGGGRSFFPTTASLKHLNCGM